jgi:uncharacterized protein (DUF2147 family)
MRTVDRDLSGPERSGRSSRLGTLLRLHLALLLAAVTLLWSPRTMAQAAVPQGIWLLDQRAAVRIFECDGLMCGQIAWLSKPRDTEGVLNVDALNPDPALRNRPLCGVTMIWSLRPDGPKRWRGGWFYNADDGKTYRVSAQLISDDVMAVRVYLGLPLFGETKKLVRVPQDASEGWC